MCTIYQKRVDIAVPLGGNKKRVQVIRIGTATILGCGWAAVPLVCGEFLFVGCETARGRTTSKK